MATLSGAPAGLRGRLTAFVLAFREFHDLPLFCERKRASFGPASHECPPLTPLTTLGAVTEILEYAKWLGMDEVEVQTA